MTKITATFSNGHTDTYKGKRAVTAAWMIVRKSDGKVVMSGHSLTRELAEKTSAGNVKEYFARGWAVTKPNRQCNRTYWANLAKKNGFATHAEFYAACLALRAEQAQAYTTEVVSL